jgi:hypothetical protein
MGGLGDAGGSVRQLPQCHLNLLPRWTTFVLYALVACCISVCDVISWRSPTV